MIKLLGAILLLVSTTAVFGQESLVPIGFEPRGAGKKNTLKSTETLDSTFVYTYDTLSLPILDEFSTSKFQNHAAGFNDPNVTEQQYFRMLDLSDVPLPANAVFTSQITKRYSTNAGIDTETDLISTPIKLASLSSYPIQYSTVNAYPPYYIFDTLDFPNDSDTIFMDLPDYRQDSARIFSAHLSDQNAIWVDSSAYRNFTHAVNPWTLGVATFDGLDPSGYPYLFGSTSTGYADFLTSKTIDLSSSNPNDSIYLTFIVQRKGLGDEPEPNDSLVVEFFNSIENDWDRVWSMNGGALGDFQLGHIRLKEANYLTDGFRFRFKNYGGLSGMLDEFHLDYVYLRSGSGFQDTLLKDFAFVYPLGSLIETYTQVPWDHWVNDPTHMNPNVAVTVRNGSNIQESWSDGNVDVKVAGVTEGSFTLIGQDLANGDLNYGPRTVYESYHDFSTGYSFTTTPPAEEKTFEVIATATAPFAHIAVNDTSYTTQYFGNEYAYDDGSAEAGYGVTGVQARFAYRFDPYEADTLIGLKIHFVPTVTDVSDKLFLITVWADNNGVPGNVLYTDDFFNARFPVYEDARGVFTTYYLNDTFVSLAEAPFYVGYRQIDADRLNVGFDRNIDNSSKGFYSLNGGVTWSGTSLAGSPMIRPVFSTSNNYDLGLFEPAQAEVNWTVYPNPTSGIVTIRFDQADSYQGAIVRSISGQVIGTLSKEETSFSLENYPQGMYFIEAIGVPSMAKVVRQ